MQSFIRHIPLIRRPFYQRDVAVAERDRLRQQLEQAGGRDAGRHPTAADEFHAQVARTLHRGLQESAGWGGITGAATAHDDGGVIGRIAAAYRLSVKSQLGPAESMWLTTIEEKRRQEHDLLISGDASSLAGMFRNPASNNLLYGFDHTVRETPTFQGWIDHQGRVCFDNLLRLAEAVGTIDLDYPEAPPRVEWPDVEVVLAGLDEAFGFRIEFPNPFPDVSGLKTERGIATYRAIQGLYQGWRISREAPASRVLEIGGGLGWTAFYAKAFGVAEYTIIDIPLTGAAQAYFLHRCGLGVSLLAEAATADAIRLLPPDAFYRSRDRYDLVVNVDSFTEMAVETASDYFDEASRRSPKLLSINHEHNPQRVFDIIQRHQAVAASTRELYWMRRGYVYEVVTFKSAIAD